MAMMNLFPRAELHKGVGRVQLLMPGASLDPARGGSICIDFDLRPTDKDTFSFKHQTWYTKSAGIEVAGRASTWGCCAARYDFTADIANLSYTQNHQPEHGERVLDGRVLQHGKRPANG